MVSYPTVAKESVGSLLMSYPTAVEKLSYSKERNVTVMEGPQNLQRIAINVLIRWMEKMRLLLLLFLHNSQIKESVVTQTVCAYVQSAVSTACEAILRCRTSFLYGQVWVGGKSQLNIKIHSLKKKNDHHVYFPA